MKLRSIASVLIVSLLLILCVGCKAVATMPHSSDEYENGEWTTAELVTHLKELGFTDIKIEEYTTYDESNAKIQVLVAEDSTSWFPAYRDFEKGEIIDILRNITIRETKLLTSISAYYSTKRDKTTIFIDDIEKKIYKTSKRSSVVSVYSYEGSIIDVENGIDSPIGIFKIEGNDIKQYSSAGEEWQSYSISGRNTEKPSYIDKNIKLIE